jgi:hypothetical protein
MVGSSFLGGDATRFSPSAEIDLEDLDARI